MKRESRFVITYDKACQIILNIYIASALATSMFTESKYNVGSASCAAVSCFKKYIVVYCKNIKLDENISNAIIIHISIWYTIYCSRTKLAIRRNYSYDRKIIKLWRSSSSCVVYNTEALNWCFIFSRVGTLYESFIYFFVFFFLKSIVLWIERFRFTEP